MHVSFGKNFRDTTPIGHDVSFEQFVKLIREMPRHHGQLLSAQYAVAGKRERTRDKDSRWFLPAVFVRPERVAAAVLELSGFVCDFDDGAIGRNEITEALGTLQYVAWTSYSHSDSKEKWRVVIPYDRPIEPAQHKAVYEHYQRVFGGHLDPRCATISQLWYLPGHPRDAAPTEILAVLDGPYFSPAALGRNSPAPQAGGIAGGIVGVLAARAKDNDDLTSRGPTSLRDLASALGSLNPSNYGGYTEWLNIGMAVFDGAQGSQDGYELFDGWSQKCPNYGGPESTREKWYSFGGRAGLARITSATLFKQAQEAGWTGAVNDLHGQPPGDNPAPAPSVPASDSPKNPPASSGNSGIPAQLVLPLIVTAPVPIPDGWRAHPVEFAMQRKVDDPNTGNQMWQTTVRGSRFLSLELLQGIDEMWHTAELKCENKSGTVTATFEVGEIMKAEFRALLGDRGILTSNGNEFKYVQEVIVDWLKKIQNEQRVRQSFSHLGWMESGPTTIGFALGDTAYFADGRVETGIKVAGGGGTTIAKHYIPQGDLQTWKSISQFLTSQGRPELMAILATSFGSPLMKFSGHSGAVVSIISTASGVGKSTALSLAQSVWGNPKSAIHSATDTVLSLSSKMGFTKDLPAYWDDIKGEKTFQQFAEVIYQITQGKEKARLTQQATLREVETWNCLAVVAANDSIIEIVKRYGRGTDAGAARIFEIRLEERPPMSQQATFFDRCTTNYGRAGEVYSAWLATNHDRARRLVETLSERLSAELQVESEERFWMAAIATMIAGAMIAKQLKLVDFDVPALTAFLKARFLELRSGKTEAVKEAGAGRVVADLIYDFQQTTLIISVLPTRTQKKTVSIRPPKNGEVDVLLAAEERILRIRRAKFGEWCRTRSLSADTLLLKLQQTKAVIERNVDPMAGVKPYSTDSRTICYDIDLALLDGVTDGSAGPDNA